MQVVIYLVYANESCPSFYETYFSEMVFLFQAEPLIKNVKKIDVPVSGLVYGALGSEELVKASENEYEMALQDRVMEETKEKRNAVEAYVYDMRNKVCRV